MILGIKKFCYNFVFFITIIIKKKLLKPFGYCVTHYVIKILFIFIFNNKNLKFILNFAKSTVRAKRNYTLKKYILINYRYFYFKNCFIACF